MIMMLSALVKPPSLPARSGPATGAEVMGSALAVS
jgi:hypothetical protein